MTDLFTSAGEDIARGNAPLAVRMRPATLDEVVGQGALVGPGTPLRRLAEGGRAPSSLILWGPPGTGKTTLATLVARAGGRHFVELSAVMAGVKDVRAVVDDARRRLGASGQETVLFVDEVHRFSRTQQDALLPSVENRWVVLVAATTENPSFSVVSPLLSRSLLLTLQPLTEDDIRTLVRRAVRDPRGLSAAVALSDGAEEHLLRVAGGDARRALTALEAAAAAVSDRARGAGRADVPVIDVAILERAIDKASVRYDRAGDQHYDVISAFIKSMRGSDVDAALHYLARMIEAGEDPRFIARRIVVHASEDVGLADPSVMLTAAAAAQAVQLLGMPEARIPLAQAVIAVATAPKSNAVVAAIDAALSDVRRGLAAPVPAHLRDAHYTGAARLEHGAGYRYSHDYPHGIAEQQYAPDPLVGRDYYLPGGNGAERALGERVAKLRQLVRGLPVPDAAQSTAATVTAEPMEQDDTNA